mmetsp:Transcript_137570/g.383680  ORF Transcript_137570/g.383680 Transcript_137570/m.383680 type:complete len:212 (+) Transcript_137570:1188-1823(+)
MHGNTRVAVKQPATKLTEYNWSSLVRDRPKTLAKNSFNWPLAFAPAAAMEVSLLVCFWKSGDGRVRGVPLPTGLQGPWPLAMGVRMGVRPVGESLHGPTGSGGRVIMGCGDCGHLVPGKLPVPLCNRFAAGSATTSLSPSQAGPSATRRPRSSSPRTKACVASLLRACTGGLGVKCFAASSPTAANSARAASMAAVSASSALPQTSLVKLM